jgi:hypothetical protein
MRQVESQTVETWRKALEEAPRHMLVLLPEADGSLMLRTAASHTVLVEASPDVSEILATHLFLRCRRQLTHSARRSRAVTAFPAKTAGETCRSRNYSNGKDL